MSAEENMALARRFMEARIKGDLAAVDEMLAADFVNHNRLVPGQEPDRENYMRGISAYQAALSEQSGDPLRRICHPRSRGAYGRGS
jgi:ketosteroid isomerase-like protein